MIDQETTPRKTHSSELLIKLVPIAVIAVALSLGAYFTFFHETSNVPSAPVVPAHPRTTPDPSVAANTPPVVESAVIDQLSVEQLLKEAGTALKEQRLVTPAGNNALEFYLRILEKEPKNQAAVDALRELFPFATGAVEQNISAGQLDDAKRVIDLLAKSDPANYTLTILRGRLDAKKKVVDREQAQLAAAAAAAAAAANRASPPPAPAQATPVTGNPPPSRPPVTTAGDNTAANTPSMVKPPVANSNSEPAARTVAEAPPPTVSAPPSASAAASSNETHDVIIVKTVAPEYPREAVRKRQEGWVEVEFTVEADGQVTDAHVVTSEPGSVFDREAVRAVQRWTFKPKIENGQPTASRLKRRIEFKLTG